MALVCSVVSYAQTDNSRFNQSTTLPGGNQKDSTHAKSNTGAWKDEDAAITYELLNNRKTYIPDTALHTFQRRPFVQTWARDLGNLGSPIQNLLFTPEYRVGPSLGYHIFDAYRFIPDSLKYYNTTNPYSVFSYQLGTKLEQVAGIMYTQNIKPNWNFMVDYRKTNSPGFFKTNRNNHDNFGMTTNYKSLNRHYTLYAAMVYNKEQHDENGGIVNDSELNNPDYYDRGTVDAAYQNSQYSITRSPVSNVLRDFGLMIQNNYTWGRIDTTYNTDSTQYTYKLKPRFSLSHKLELSTEKHTYKDLAPDSLRYVSLFNASLPAFGTYIMGEDSVFTQQMWFWVDNKFMLNGFIGKDDKQLRFSAGFGTRYDQFTSQPVSNLIIDSLPNKVYTTGMDRGQTVSNYLAGEISKEALHSGEWEYKAAATLFATGDYAGNFDLNAMIGKEFKNNRGGFVAGFSQQLGSAPYSYTHYENNFVKLFYTFNKESITNVYLTFEEKKWRFSAGIKNYIIDNYIYLNNEQVPSQYAIPFNQTQAWIRKIFKVGSFYLDNEMVYQQITGNAPVNVPALMGRHQFAFEKDLFNRKLKITTGFEVRYNTSYYAPGYSALLNRFYYQNTTYVSNNPELNFFFNFRFKHFRAFVMADQLQQLFGTNTILFTGTPSLNFYGNGASYMPVYASQNTCIRFGFSWVLVN